MAVTAAGAHLAEQHRQAQLQVRARALRDYLELWPLWRGDDDSFLRMAAAAFTLVQMYRGVSSSLAASFYEAFRLAEGVPGRPTPRLAPDVERDRVVGTLWLLGRDKVQVRDDQLADAIDALSVATRAAMQSAFVETSGAVSTYVLEGGRETIVGSVKADPQAVGWARQTDGRPCAFCLMLASRGAVYKEDTVGFQAHDHCGCSAVPVFDRNDPLPQNRRWLDVYNRATREARAAGELRRGTDNDLLNALRRYLSHERAGG